MTRGPYDDPIYVADIARAVGLACFAQRPASRSYNIASEKPYAYDDLAAAIRQALPGLSFEPGDEPEAAQFHRQRDTLDVGLAKAELNFVPEYDLERGIAATAAWLAKFKDRLSR